MDKVVGIIALTAIVGMAYMLDPQGAGEVAKLTIAAIAGFVVGDVRAKAKT